MDQRKSRKDEVSKPFKTKKEQDKFINKFFGSLSSSEGEGSGKSQSLSQTSMKSFISSPGYRKSPDMEETLGSPIIPSGSIMLNTVEKVKKRELCKQIFDSSCTTSDSDNHATPSKEKTNQKTQFKFRIVDETQIDDRESMDVTEPENTNGEEDPFASDLDLDDDMFADTEMSASQTSEPPPPLEAKKTEDFPKFDRFDSTGNEQDKSDVELSSLRIKGDTSTRSKNSQLRGTDSMDDQPSSSLRTWHRRVESSQESPGRKSSQEKSKVSSRSSRNRDHSSRSIKDYCSSESSQDTSSQKKKQEAKSKTTSSNKNEKSSLKTSKDKSCQSKSSKTEKQAAKKNNFYQSSDDEELPDISSRTEDLFARKSSQEKEKASKKIFKQKESNKRTFYDSEDENECSQNSEMKSSQKKDQNDCFTSSQESTRSFSSRSKRNAQKKGRKNVVDSSEANEIDVIFDSSQGSANKDKYVAFASSGAKDVEKEKKSSRQRNVKKVRDGPCDSEEGDEIDIVYESSQDPKKKNSQKYVSSSQEKETPKKQHKEKDRNTKKKISSATSGDESELSQEKKTYQKKVGTEKKGEYSSFGLPRARETTPERSRNQSGASSVGDLSPETRKALERDLDFKLDDKVLEPKAKPGARKKRTHSDVESSGGCSQGTSRSTSQKRNAIGAGGASLNRSPESSDEETDPMKRLKNFKIPKLSRQKPDGAEDKENERGSAGSQYSNNRSYKGKSSTAGKPTKSFSFFKAEDVAAHKAAMSGSKGGKSKSFSKVPEVSSQEGFHRLFARAPGKNNAPGPGKVLQMVTNEAGEMVEKYVPRDKAAEAIRKKMVKKVKGYEDMSEHQQALLRYAFSMEEPKVPAAKRKFSPPPSLSPPRRSKEKLASLSSASEDDEEGGGGPSTSSTASTSKKKLKQKKLFDYTEEQKNLREMEELLKCEEISAKFRASRPEYERTQRLLAQIEKEDREIARREAKERRLRREQEEEEERYEDENAGYRDRLTDELTQEKIAQYFQAYLPTLESIARGDEDWCWRYKALARDDNNVQHNAICDPFTENQVQLAHNEMKKVFLRNAEEIGQNVRLVSFVLMPEFLIYVYSTMFNFDRDETMKRIRNTPLRAEDDHLGAWVRKKREDYILEDEEDDLSDDLLSPI